MEYIGIKSISSIDFNHSHRVNFLIKFRFADIKKQDNTEKGNWGESP